MKNLIKSLWIPVVIGIAIIAIFAFLWIVLGVFISLFQSDLLMYIWYEIFLATIAGAAAVTIKTSNKTKGIYKVIYYLVSFIIISNIYYGMGRYGILLNIFYM